MRQTDIYMVVIALVMVVLLTFIYLQERSPSLVLSKEDLDMEIHNEECFIKVTGKVRNEGDVTAVNPEVFCNVLGAGNKIIGNGSDELTNIYAHKLKEFKMTIPLACENMSVGLDLSCYVKCENCPVQD